MSPTFHRRSTSSLLTVTCKLGAARLSHSPTSPPPPISACTTWYMDGTEVTGRRLLSSRSLSLSSSFLWEVNWGQLKTGSRARRVTRSHWLLILDSHTHTHTYGPAPVSLGPQRGLPSTTGGTGWRGERDASLPLFCLYVSLLRPRDETRLHRRIGQTSGGVAALPDVRVLRGKEALETDFLKKGA